MHGTTHGRPRERFERNEEKAALRPLPSRSVPGVRSRGATGRGVEGAAGHDGVGEGEPDHGDGMSSSGGLCGIVPGELYLGWGTVHDVEFWHTASDRLANLGLADVLDGSAAPAEGEPVADDRLDNLVRRCLREVAWLELMVAPILVVHFGYDMRVIVASSTPIGRAT